MLRYRVISRFCAAAGVLCIGAGAVIYVASHNLFEARSFGHHVAESLSEPGVKAYASHLVADSVVRSHPDLIAVRPFIQATADGLVSARAFQALVGSAAERAHEAAFSQGAQRLILSIPDLQILVQNALSQATPEIYAKIPKQIQTAVASLGDSHATQILIDVFRLGRRLNWLWQLLFPAGVALLVVAVWAATDRREGLVQVGKELAAAGLLLAALIPAARIGAIVIENPLERELARGLVRTFFGDLNGWAWFLCGLGILIAAGASSLLESIDPLSSLRRAMSLLVTPPRGRLGRLGWGLTLLVIGLLMSFYPLELLRGAVIIAGLMAAYVGIREVFRLFHEALDRGRTKAVMQTETSAAFPLVAVVALVAVLGAMWIIWRDPTVQLAEASVVTACNGYPELCDRRVDEVAFAGAHNAMSSQDIPGWMFPHHEAGMPHQLAEGVRALLFDVHRGFPGGSRIKTDMGTEPNADKIRQAVGAEGYAAALRVRNRLVGVDEGNPGLYLCHGFCELGAYELTPSLAEIRRFLITHPDEVLLFIIEDYASPAEIEEAFNKSGLSDFVYQGSNRPNWPTLRELIASGRRVIVFIESGRTGVPWLRPAFESIEETPYTFHRLDEFSCRPNRGGDSGSLFLLNHWIDTTPAPRPSNAAIVNAFPFLLQRATQCGEERKHMPTIIAVDFYRTGDLLRVVNKLNKVSDHASQ